MTKLTMTLSLLGAFSVFYAITAPLAVFFLMVCPHISPAAFPTALAKRMDTGADRKKILKVVAKCYSTRYTTLSETPPNEFCAKNGQP